MTAPRVARARAELDAALAPVRGVAGRVCLVPTMGALHSGHAALIREARGRAGANGASVVSIFVNPLQFAPGEDLDRYPRTFEADLRVCEDQGVDVVFAPSLQEVYPGSEDRLAEPQVTVDPGQLGAVLEGVARPGHFRGVLTVVAKLFGLVRPDVALFGLKDYQQLVLVRRMVADLCLGVEVLGTETVREEDGLALSSRNRYLSPQDRHTALRLSAALRAGAAAGAEGVEAVRQTALGVLHGSASPGTAAEFELDYLEVTSPDLGPAPERGPARLLVAARVGSTRLIDNVAVELAAAS